MSIPTVTLGENCSAKRISAAAVSYLSGPLRGMAEITRNKSAVQCVDVLTRDKPMPVHSFVAEISGFVPETPNFENAFYEAGCDDALIVVVNDKLRLDFDREASSYQEAVDSARRDIEKAGAHVLSIRPLVEAT